jgi:phosphoribosylaminoimidazole-succinocarboxamide synthase
MSSASPYLRSGKVRDLYALGTDRLVLVASDRISAFDVVLPTAIPDKGRVLTGLSRHWFAETYDLVPNHLLATSPEDAAGLNLPPDVAGDLRGRVMICRRATVLPIEIIVRGYVSGSGWKDYQRTGGICGIPLPEGLVESDRLPDPIFTPSTKAEQGAHDENIDFDAAAMLIGAPLAERVRDIALRLYRSGSASCERAGIILADTKFEFGLIGDELILVDEVMTPDSSRFWDAGTYQPGGPQPSYDKQFVRDWLETQAWDKTAPGPELPPEVVAGTRARYVEAFERITGASFERYLRDDVIAPEDVIAPDQASVP